MRAERGVFDDPAVALARPSVSMIDNSRPGRADMTPMRSASIAASSSAWVMRKIVAPVSRHSLQELLAHQEAGLLVERAERLVEQDEARLHDERAGDADALAHAAGELRRIALGEVDEPHDAQGIARPARGAPCRTSFVLRRPNAMLRSTVSHGIEASSWNTTPMPSGTLPSTGLPSKLDRALGRGGEPSDQLEQGRLAAARRPDHGEELAFAQVEIERSRARGHRRRRRWR